MIIARKVGIIDHPNPRSSHTHLTVRGGGIIFWFAALSYFIYKFPDQSFFFIGLTIIAIGSFIDDIRHINQWIKFIVHAAGAIVVFIGLKVFDIWPLYLVIIAYIIYIGILNGYNFMDGINGMTGLYSISLLTALQYINMNIIPLADPDFIWFPIIASVVFLFFNFKKRALCFAGDVGSITLAFWIVYILMILTIKTGSIVWILLMAVYGIDTVLTIFHRLFLRQNIFKAHRMHFYQVLANEFGMDHRIVSLFYTVTQGLVSIIVISFWDKWPVLLLASVILIPLSLVYCLKFRIIAKGAFTTR